MTLIPMIVGVLETELEELEIIVEMAKNTEKSPGRQMIWFSFFV